MEWVRVIRRDVAGLPLTLFGYGQGLVMAPLSGAVLSTVPPASAGSGSGMYGTTAQIANAAGVAAIGAVYFAVEAAGSTRVALSVSIRAVCAVDYDQCRISVMDAPRVLTLIVTIRGQVACKVNWTKFPVNDSARPFHFAVQQLSGLGRVENLYRQGACRCLLPKMSNSCDACPV